MDRDSDFPPVTSCAVCGQASCPGCPPAQVQREVRSGDELFFERHTLSLRLRLVTTALESSSSPERMFGRRLRGANLKDAWLFAWLSEGLALGSLFVVGLSIFAVGFPKIFAELLGMRGAYAFVGAAYVAAVGFLVGVHWLWGLALDYGAAAFPEGSSEGSGTSPAVAIASRSGVQFGLYACGWDLVTSPLGLVLVWLHVPRGQRRSALVGALRAPQIALRVYFLDALALSEPRARVAQRRALAVALVAFGVTLVVFFVGSFWLLWASDLGLAGYP
jgi:hypothetical protein